MPRRTEPDAYALKIGERIRALRLERNMSLADLADVAGVSKGHISSIEHGLAAITIETIAKISKGFGLPPLYIVAAPDGSEQEQVVDLIRKLPMPDVVKLRRELTKAVKEAAKAAKPAKPQAARAKKLPA